MLLQGREFQINGVASNHIGEMLLGIDWLEKQLASTSIHLNHAFRSYIRTSVLCDDSARSNCMDPAQLVDCYTSALAALIDKHAPMTSVKHRQRMSTTFLTMNANKKKKVMRRLKRLYKNKRPGSSRANWISAKRDYRTIVDLKKSNYWKN